MRLSFRPELCTYTMKSVPMLNQQGASVDEIWASVGEVTESAVTFWHKAAASHTMCAKWSHLFLRLEKGHVCVRQTFGNCRAAHTCTHIHTHLHSFTYSFTLIFPFSFPPFFCLIYVVLLCSLLYLPSFCQPSALTPSVVTGGAAAFIIWALQIKTWQTVLDR